MIKKTPNHLLQEVLNIFKERSTIHQEIGEMSVAMFELFRSKIYEWTGIYFINEKKYLLESRITKRLVELGLYSFEEYVVKLDDAKFLEVELPYLYSAITINETFFFRCPEHIDTFVKVVIPELILHKQQNDIEQKITVWSAGCSSGEEAFTLAIVIKEELQPLYPNVIFEILATDIDEKVLKSARRGLFSEYSIRHIPAVYFSKYFQKIGSQYQIDAEICSMVQCFSLNLYDKTQWEAIPKVDCIFCCNVLIYFDENSKREVLTGFYYQMEEIGYLFVGYSESLYGIDSLFIRHYSLNSLAYKKNELTTNKNHSSERNVYKFKSIF